MIKPIHMIFIGVIVITITITTLLFISDNITYKEERRIKSLRDSLEMEYYKKQLESFPFEHSEIKDTTVNQ